MELLDAWWMWTGFAALVVSIFLIDLFVGGGKQHQVSFREAAIWSLIWVLVACSFNGGIWLYLDNTVSRELANQKSLEFFTGYFEVVN